MVRLRKMGSIERSNTSGPAVTNPIHDKTFAQYVDKPRGTASTLDAGRPRGRAVAGYRRSET
jgi:hypothetical protein